MAAQPEDDDAIPFFFGKQRPVVDAECRTGLEAEAARCIEAFYDRQTLLNLISGTVAGKLTPPQWWLPRASALDR